MTGLPQDDPVLGLFREEAGSQLAALTDGVFALQRSSRAAPVLEALSDTTLGLQSAARIVGADPAAALTQALHSVFSAALAGRCVLATNSTEVFLTALDCLSQLVSEAPGGGARASEVPEIIEALDRLSAPPGHEPQTPPESQGGSPGTSSDQPPSDGVSRPSLDPVLFAMFREEAEQQIAALTAGLLSLESTSATRPSLEQLMRAAHSLKGAARIVGVDGVVGITHAMEDLFVAALDGTRQIDARGVDTLLGAVDGISAFVASSPSASRPGSEPWTDLLASIAAVGSGAASTPAGERRPPTGAGAAGQALRGQETPRAAGPSSRSIRLAVESLERFAGLAAESLVEAERLASWVEGALELRRSQREVRYALLGARDALVAETGAGQRAHGSLRSHIDEALAALAAFERLVADRESAMDAFARRNMALAQRLSRESLATRTLAFSSITRGFPRLVRDLNRQLGKRSRLEIRGENTLVDRDLLEELDSSVTHLLRNALDHGMETPDAREAAGKPAEGRVEVDAFHQEGRLHVLIRDDGRGIDAEAVRARVVERGLESPENAARLSEAEIHQFLFLPGFSTARSVTEISGRGVGLDAVRSQVQRMGGSVSIRSTPGRGSTFVIELPVSTSATRALVVHVSGELVALPSTDVHRVLRVGAEDVDHAGSHRSTRVDGQPLPLVSAADVLGLPGSAPGGPVVHALLLADSERRLGLVVDGVRGEESFVLRKLDSRFGHVPGVAHVSTDADGAAVFLLDVSELLRSMDALVSAGASRLPETQDSPARSRKKRILVVEDSLTVRQAERQMLENHGYRVDVAVDGIEGWSALREGAYDLVVSDVDMPRLNGLDLVRRIRSDERLRDLPVVIVSYKDRDEDRQSGMEAGASHYLAKAGFQDSALVQVVKQLIGEAELS